jgi:hypothetical protein
MAPTIRPLEIAPSLQRNSFYSASSSAFEHQVVNVGHIQPGLQPAGLQHTLQGQNLGGHVQMTELQHTLQEPHLAGPAQATGLQHTLQEPHLAGPAQTTGFNHGEGPNLGGKGSNDFPPGTTPPKKSFMENTALQLTAFVGVPILAQAIGMGVSSSQASKAAADQKEIAAQQMALQQQANAQAQKTADAGLALQAAANNQSAALSQAQIDEQKREFALSQQAQQQQQGGNTVTIPDTP